LQIAKQTGVQKLFEEGGVKALLKTLEQDLLLLRRQAAMELYNAEASGVSRWPPTFFGLQSTLASARHADSMAIGRTMPFAPGGSQKAGRARVSPRMVDRAMTIPKESNDYWNFLRQKLTGNFAMNLAT
jgi:hypothetical protein